MNWTPIDLFLLWMCCAGLTYWFTEFTLFYCSGQRPSFRFSWRSLVSVVLMWPLLICMCCLVWVLELIEWFTD